MQALIDEGECIQKRLGKTTGPSNTDTSARAFRYLLLQGKIQSALRYLSRNTNGGVLKLDDLIPETRKNGEPAQRSTRDVLEEKHSPADARCLLPGDPEPANP